MRSSSIYDLQQQDRAEAVDHIIIISSYMIFPPINIHRVQIKMQKQRYKHVMNRTET